VSEPPRARAQVEPLAALAAAVAVVAAVSLYAGALERSLPTPSREVAEPTLDRVRAALTDGGVAVPARLERAARRGPSGYAVNATLATGAVRRSAGPTPPPSADAARTRIGVRIGPGRVRSGALSVAVWERGEGVRA